MLLPAALYEHTENIYKAMQEYAENGANLLIAPTYLCYTENSKKDAIRQTVNAAGANAFVCGAVTPLGEKIKYSGTGISYDEYYLQMKKEIAFLYENGANSVLFLFGFNSLLEAKCAVYAAKEVCDLPICVLLDFKDKQTLADGFNMVSTLITLQSLGISALGVMADDCDQVLDILLEMKTFSSVPLFAFPNAQGLITPIEFAQYAQNFVNNKCVMFGAGKGSDARFTAQIAKELWQLEPFLPDFPTINAACGREDIYFLDFQNQIIGQNKSLLEIDLEKISKLNEVDAIIDSLVKNGLPPICFSTKDIEILERAIKLYPGRAAIRSDEYGEITAKEYGALILSSDKGEM